MSIFSRRSAPVKTRVFWNPFNRRWSAFYHALFPGGRTPELWEFQVANYLFHHGYEREQIHEILKHAAYWGTVESCRELKYDDDDRDHIERLLPVQPDHRWARYEEFIWELGPAHKACA